MTSSSEEKITIEMGSGQVRVTDAAGETVHAIGTPEAFAAISRAWLRSGWDNKYVYAFTWLGRPIIQLPEDMIRIQEVIHSVRPDLIIETGVAHGGSLIYYASLCKAMERGRVVGIDNEIRPANRVAIEEHVLSPYITLIDGSSIDSATIEKVKAEAASAASVLVLLDSCHSKEHVLTELKAYAPMVSPGSYIVAMDGIMEEVAGAPRTRPDWTWNNPRQAALEFVQENSGFRLEEPQFPFNEGNIKQRVTYWPGAFIKRLSPSRK
jgi:cephalosporin hydroxylase